MTEQAKQTPQELKQSVLDRLEEAKKAVEELSEEDLASIVGGAFSRQPQQPMFKTMSVSESPGYSAGPPQQGTKQRSVARHKIGDYTTMAMLEGAKL